jgi:phosphoribosyl 1,2-cyclic phosphodiesterase
MSNSNYVKFLGTAGGRWVVSRQQRATGGLYIEYEGTRMHVDPGPGALVRCAMADPPIDASLTQAVLLTHAHIDHSNDVNIIIDAMTAGGFNKGGTLFAPHDCLDGPSPVVFQYLRKHLDEIIELTPSTEYKFANIPFKTSIDHNHGHQTYGIKFDFGGHEFALLIDTRYFDGLGEAYASADTLVVYVTFFDTPPHPKILHLSLHDAKMLIEQAKPKRAILTHFGTTMLENDPERIAAEMTQASGIETIAAFDGMRIGL